MGRSLPPLNALKAFEAAARHMSFTRAADELRVTPGAVSHQIRGLEDQLSMPLFERRNNVLKLTEAGLVYLPYVKCAFDQLTNGTSRLQGAGLSPRSLRIAVMPTFALRWLLPRLSRFFHHQPTVEIALTTAADVSDMEAGSADLGIFYGEGPWSGFTADLLFHEELIPVCSPRCLELSGALEKPGDLARLVFIEVSSTPDAWSHWMRAAEIPHLNMPRRHSVDTCILAIHAALEGYGVMLANHAFVEDDLSTKRLMAPVEISARRDKGWFLLRPEGSTPGREVSAFREWILSEHRGAERDVHL